MNVFLLAASLTIGGSARPWVEVQIVPKYLAQYDRSFEIKTKDVDEHWKQFEISVRAKAGKRMLSPFTSGYLALITSEEFAADVPVEVHQKGDRTAFWFRISRKALESSKFEIREQGWEPVYDAKGQPTRDAVGKPIYEMTLGGQAFWLYLKDFAAP